MPPDPSRLDAEHSDGDARRVHDARKMVTVEVTEHMAEILRGAYAIVPVAPELVPQLREGVSCAGVQLVCREDGLWDLVVKRDADIPFEAAP